MTFQISLSTACRWLLQNSHTLFSELTHWMKRVYRKMDQFRNRRSWYMSYGCLCLNGQSEKKRSKTNTPQNKIKLTECVKINVKWSELKRTGQTGGSIRIKTKRTLAVSCWPLDTLWLTDEFEPVSACAVQTHLLRQARGLSKCHSNVIKARVRVVRTHIMLFTALV